MLIPPHTENVKKAVRADLWDFFCVYASTLRERERARLENLPFHKTAFPIANCVKRDAHLRWMLFQGHIEHLRPFPDPTAEPIPSQNFTHTSCFILTDIGEKFADDMVIAPARRENDYAMLRGIVDQLYFGPLPPRYDSATRVLSWGCHVIKRFTQSASRQECILQAAEEMGWPAYFDDPLPRKPGTNPKKVLHDTIQDLNPRQKAAWLCFKSGGAGTRIRCEIRYSLRHLGDGPATIFRYGSIVKPGLVTH